MSPHEHATNGFGKWAAGVLAAVALLGIPMALQVPQGQRIDFNRENIVDVRNDLKAHKEGDGHAGTMKALAELSERFKEVETQFRMYRLLEDEINKGLKTEVEELREWQKRWAARMEDAWAGRAVTK